MAEQIPDFDLYAELEVSRTASTDTINAAYRTLAKRYHPDTPPGEDDRIERINTAHAWLSDPERRSGYDASRTGVSAAQPATTAAKRNGAGRSGRRERRARSASRPSAAAAKSVPPASPWSRIRSTRFGAAGLVVGGVAVAAVLFVLVARPGGIGSAGAGPSSDAPTRAYLAGCPTSQPPALPAGETRTITLSTEKGDIVLKIEADLSPIAAGNFVALAECGWYDNVVFHRLVPTFVIQGGDGQFGRYPNVDPERVGSGGPPYTIQDEPVTTPYHRGVVAMARSEQPNSVGSQFFIVLDDSAAGSLSDANTYQIIGEVTSGMDAVDAIAAMPNGGRATGNAALQPVPMTNVTVANP